MSLKTLMLLGGLIGFGIGIGFGAAQHGAWPAVLFKASLAAYVGGLLLRWWGRIWIHSLREAAQQSPPAAPAPVPTKAPTRN